MKKTKGLGLIIAVIILAVLIAAYYIITGISKKEDTKKTEAAEAASSAAQAALPWAVSADDIASFSVTNTNGTFTFEKDGTGWKLKEDPSFELNQDTVTAKTTTISGIAAASTIDTPDALADYGLDKPTVTLTVTRTDGGSYTLLFGSENTAASVYYMMYQGKEDKVYTVYAVTEQTFEFQESDLAPASDASTSGSAAAVTASSAEAATSAAASAATSVATSAATSAGAETSSSDAAASAAE